MARVNVDIPTPLQNLTQNKAKITLAADDIHSLILALDEKFPGMIQALCDEGNKIKKFINIYVNAEDIRFLKSDKTELKDNDTVYIIPAIAGG